MRSDALPRRIIIALTWPLGVLAAAVTVTGLVAASLVLFPRVGIVAAAIGAVGVFAKEFAAAPLVLLSLYEASVRRWPAFLRTLAAANAVFIVWAVFHLTMIIRFNYGYGGTPSSRQVRQAPPAFRSRRV